MNWGEGFSRLRLILAVLLVAVATLGFLGELWSVGETIIRYPTEIAAGIIVAGAIFLIGYWVVAGFRKPR